MHAHDACIHTTSIHMYISACTASSKFHVGIHMFTNRYICLSHIQRYIGYAVMCSYMHSQTYMQHKKAGKYWLRFHINSIICTYIDSGFCFSVPFVYKSYKVKHVCLYIHKCFTFAEYARLCV